MAFLGYYTQLIDYTLQGLCIHFFPHPIYLSEFYHYQPIQIGLVSFDFALEWVNLRLVLLYRKMGCISGSLLGSYWSDRELISSKCRWWYKLSGGEHQA